MALKMFLVFVTVLANVEYLATSPTRRQYIAITEATASDSPVTNGEVWDDNDDFDLDGDGWFSRSAISSSPVPEKVQDMNDYAEDYSRASAMADFGEDDDDDQEDLEDDEQDVREQESEEIDEEDAKDSEFLFSSPKDTRLVLEDDDDEQSGPIKVRHTGRNSYSHASEEDSINSVESSDEEDEEHPDDFAIDEDDKQDDEEQEVLPRHEDDEDEFVSEGDDNDEAFDNPEEEAAQVIYGDHVFLY